MLRIAILSGAALAWANAFIAGPAMAVPAAGTFTLADAECSQRSLRVDSINCK